MNQTQAIDFLTHLRRKYIYRKGWVYGLQSLGLGLLVAGIAGKWTESFWTPMLTGLGFAGLAALIFVKGSRLAATPLSAVALHLNRIHAPLEQSCDLVLKSAASLTLVEQLQLERVLRALEQLQTSPARLLPVSLRRTWMLLGVCVPLALAFQLIPRGNQRNPVAALRQDQPTPITSVARSLPRIRQIEIEVIPPAYTRKERYFSPGAALKVEQGALVRWTIHTDQPVPALTWILNDKVRLAIPAKQPTVFTLERTVHESGFYQLEIEKKKSDYYALEVIPDTPPQITVEHPAQPYTELAFGDPLQVAFRASLRDDYGIRQANLVATVAKGSGEGVKFREEKIALGTDFSAQRPQYQVQKKLDLQQLGMNWGDELYFYLQTWDNHQGYSRSETYFIRMEDTTLTESVTDLSMGVNPLPEYFRSQRQIIIDTEKLIKEKSGLTEEAFNNRSNALGIDQRLLRLRYGKFLGEEAESGAGDIAGREEIERMQADKGEEQEHHEHDGHDHHGEGSHDGGRIGAGNANTADMLAPYSHQHDSEEGATFLEPAVKATLKASLAQMWEAELRLRTHRPQEALPFEYKALKLLKEVQQSSRAYVKKTGFDPPPLKPQEKRLTGDLTKVQSVRNQQNTEQKPSLPYTREALRWIERQQSKPNYISADAGMLEKAGAEIAAEALRTPGAYLSALSGLRKLIAQVQAKQELCGECLATVKKACWQLLPAAEPGPAQAPQQRNRLANEYFNRLP